MNGNMNKMMKQVQKMQEDMNKLQEELGDEIVETTSGGGAVKVKANCKQEILEVNIDPEVVDPDDVEMLQDLVLTAVNEALSNAKEKANEEMNKITGGINIPGMF